MFLEYAQDVFNEKLRKQTRYTQRVPFMLDKTREGTLDFEKVPLANIKKIETRCLCSLKKLSVLTVLNKDQIFNAYTWKKHSETLNYT